MMKPAWKKSKWALALALLLGAVPPYLMPLYFTLRSEGSALTPDGALFYSIVWGGAMILLMLLILKVINGEGIRDLNLKGGKWWWDLLAGITLMVVTLGTFLLSRGFITGLFPPQAGSGNELLLDELINNPRFFLIMTGPGLLIGAGIYEELTRVFLLSRLWKFWDSPLWRWLTVILSAVVFGFMHSYQGPAGIVSTGISGLIMALFYLRFGRILPMIIAHYLHDAVQFIAAYLMFN